jgi:para-nitrobenzyl esterase
MKRQAIILAAAILCLPAAALAADPAPKSVQPIASVQISAKTSARLTVTSPAFAPGGDIPFENTMYRGNTFPGLAWTKGPRGTKSYAIIMQDPDSAFAGAPILHWTMFNIPAGVTKLDAGMTAPPAGASYGPNIRGPKHAYMGPHTPPGPKHHYHFQMFALDTILPESAGDTFGGLVAGLQGHVLAEGELVGLAQADPNAPPKVPVAPPPAAHP